MTIGKTLRLMSAIDNARRQVDEMIYPCFNKPPVLELLDGCRDFLSWVESVISDPVCLPAFVADIHRVFHQLATLAVKILLGKLAVGGVTQTKTKTDTEHTFQSRITGCSIVS